MRSERSVIAVTGADGFIGRNVVVRMRENGMTVRPIVRETTGDVLCSTLGEADVVVHLAGANRPADPIEFLRANRDYTRMVARFVAAGRRRPLVIFASSTRATEDVAYGRSKAAGEAVLLDLARRGAASVAIYRLPNVFGKWARPGYNSAVATFCHNIARGLPIRIDDPQAPLALLHVDDLITQWLGLIEASSDHSGVVAPDHVHVTTVGAVAGLIQRFASDRVAGIAPAGTPLARALYSTFIAALPAEAFSYPLDVHSDARGTFIEMLRMGPNGQVSSFTAHPGVTRGGHYHHAKVEKFLVVHGHARFRFRHILTGEQHEMIARADHPCVVESIPGWAHDVTNVGDDLLVSLIWANEAFDSARPDTVAMEV
jgi:UDP-2-acetamido-2,6-beta-L-arabino-hexul-4-ose reductase